MREAGRFAGGQRRNWLVFLQMRDLAFEVRQQEIGHIPAEAVANQ